MGSLVDGVFEDFGLLLDWAEAVFDGVVGGTEVSGDGADVNL